VAGTTTAVDDQLVFRQLQIWSPVVLIALGLFILVAMARHRTQ
jgi:hypothetical protein